MGKTVVIYKSKYGNTRIYAEWIARKLNCDIYEKTAFNKNRFREYDTIIYGGGLYAGGINGISFITGNFSRIKNKKIAIFTVGVANPLDKENLKHLERGIAKTFTPEMIDVMSYFHFRGGIDYKELSFTHRMMMSMLKKTLEKKNYDTLTEEDKQLLSTYGKRMDFTNRESIEPLIDYIREE